MILIVVGRYGFKHHGDLYAELRHNHHGDNVSCCAANSARTETRFWQVGGARSVAN